MITIREMQLDDFPQVMAIENENFSVPWTETGFFAFFIREDALFLVADDSGKIVGYIGVLTVLDEGDILNIAVEKSIQGRGIGKLLVKNLLDRMRAAGVTTLHLEVRAGNQRAIDLYEGLGFEKIGIRSNYYEEPIEDGIMMCRR